MPSRDDAPLKCGPVEWASVVFFIHTMSLHVIRMYYMIIFQTQVNPCGTPILCGFLLHGRFARPAIVSRLGEETSSC